MLDRLIFVESSGMCDVMYGNALRLSPYKVSEPVDRNVARLARLRIAFATPAECVRRSSALQGCGSSRGFREFFSRVFQRFHNVRSNFHNDLRNLFHNLFLFRGSFDTPLQVPVNPL